MALTFVALHKCANREIALFLFAALELAIVVVIVVLVVTSLDNNERFDDRFRRGGELKIFDAAISSRESRRYLK